MKQRWYVQETLGPRGGKANIYEEENRDKFQVHTEGNLRAAGLSGPGWSGKASKMRGMEGGHEQDPEGRLGTERQRGEWEHLARVSKSSSSSSVGTWNDTFDPVVSSQPCRPACSEIYWGDGFHSRLVFPSAAQNILEKVLF